MDHAIDRIKNTVINGGHLEIELLVKEALENGVGHQDIINSALIAAMEEVGQRFSAGKFFIPEMLVAAMTMKKGLGIIKPLLVGVQARAKGTILIGTVRGDLHDIGKNLVAIMLEGAGFQAIDMGVDVSVEAFVQRIKDVSPEILGLSALLTTTMPEMKKIIDALTEAGVRENVKVMVGGAPVDAGFAQRIGADGYGKDAVEAVEQARRLIGA